MDQRHHAMRFDTEIRVMRVDRNTGNETGIVHGIVQGGSIERNQDTTVTEQATLDLEGSSLFGTDLLRIWADITYADQTSESIPLGTYLWSADKRQTNGPATTIPLTLYGRLRELADDQYANPISIPAGSDLVAEAEKIITGNGLTVLPHPNSDYRNGTTLTYGLTDDQTDNKLAIANDLLTIAGWTTCRTDPYGHVILQPYTDPSRRKPSWTFTEGPTCRWTKQTTDERETFDTANQIIAIYTSQEREIIGTAKDTDPNSPTSIPNRGRVISKKYRYDDIPENQTDQQLQQMANQKAAELLATNQHAIHRVTGTHIIAPITIGDTITLDLPTQHITGTYAIRTQTITLKPGLPTQTELREAS